MLKTLRTSVLALGFMGIGALGTLTLSAAADRGERGERRGSPMAELFEGVELTDAQKAQLVELRQQGKAERQAQREDHGGRIGLLEDMLAEDTIDRDAIYEQIEARVAERRQAALDGATVMMDFLETLEPAQRATLASNLEELQARHEARMEERGERGGHGMHDDDDVDDDVDGRGERRRGR